MTKKLLIVRHAQAFNREDWNGEGKPDRFRPLTKKGEQKFSDSLLGLHKLVGHIDHIYSSELTRAMQTAEILSGHFRSSELKTTPLLNPEHSPQKLMEFIQTTNNQLNALVGHQPDLGHFLSYLTTGRKDNCFQLKKGAMCMIHLRSKRAEVEWLLTPKQLLLMS